MGQWRVRGGSNRGQVGDYGLLEQPPTALRVIATLSSLPLLPQYPPLHPPHLPIRRLPRRQAQVITLKALFRLSLQEIADELGISKESAQTHLARARTALIAVLDQEDAR